MDSLQQLLSKFEADLKYRVELKTSPSNSPEKVLLEAFKHFDIGKRGEVDFKVFLQVITVRLNIITISEPDLLNIFNHYNHNGQLLNYREFISQIYNIQMNISQHNMQINNSQFSNDNKSFTNNKFDLISDEGTVKKNIEYIIYKLRGFDLSSFFKLYKELFEHKMNENDISQSQLTVALKKLSIEISSDEIYKLFASLSNKQPLLTINRLFESLLVNFTETRKNLVKIAFSKFDYTSSGKVSLQLLRELFNAKNSFSVKEGRQTIEETVIQFNSLLDNFTKINTTQFVVSANQFTQLFSFISAYFRDEKEFNNFVENCFRYNELPRSTTSVRNEKLFKPESKLLEDLSIRTSDLGDLFTVLIDQLSLRGGKGFILFYKSLKCHDYDSDGSVFEKEFEKSIAEMRLSFSKKQIEKIFDKMAQLKQRLNYEQLMSKLVPEFDQERIEIIANLYDNILQGAYERELTFDRIVASFNPRNHPDFRNGLRADYELRTEFVECLQTFLSIYQGNNSIVPLNALLRFFEFYSRNWASEHLRSVADSAFKVKTSQSVYSLDQNTPYGTSSNSIKSFNSQHVRPSDRQSVSDVNKNKPLIQNQVTTNHNTGPQLKFYQEYHQNGTNSSRVLQQNDATNNTQNKGTFQPNPNLEIAFKKKVNNSQVQYPFSTINDQNLANTSQINTKFENYKLQSPFYTEKEAPVYFKTNNSVNQKEQIQNGHKNDYRNDLQESPDSLTSRNSRRAHSRESKFDKNHREDIDPSQRNIPHSPKEGSIVSRNLHSVREMNQQIQATVSLKSSHNFPHTEKLFEKLAHNVRVTFKIPLILQLEYDMTLQSDTKGRVDFEVFSSCLENFDLFKDFTQEEMQTFFVAQVSTDQRLHVQTFANKLRGQMNSQKEKDSVDLFDRICPPGEDEISINYLKEAFLAHRCKLRGYTTTSEVKQMFGNLVELFNSLNLSIKNKDSFDLDDFLYMLDNFAFFLSNDDEFSKVLGEAFK